MIIVLLVFSLIYFLFLGVAIAKWDGMVRRKPLPKSKDTDQLFFSVIIPARNEREHIGALLNALSNQHFSPVRFEVLLIDDHSEDDTVAIARAIGAALPLSLRIISLKEEESEGFEMKGKKRALQKGITAARGEIIVTTDADCVMGEDWLQSIHDYFVSKGAKMLVGPVTYHTAENLFGQLQIIEFAALVGTGAVSLGFGQPNMCNGANLAFEKQAFERVGGYKDNMHIPSGDDEFLLQKIYKQFPQQVFFNANPKGIVATYPAENIKSFVAQRKRWGGKWRLHKSLSVKLLALFIFFFHLVLLVSLVWTIFGELNPYMFAGTFLIKSAFEYFFLKRVLHHLGKPLYFKHFVFLQAIYSLYILVLGMLANSGTFEWKGRKY